MPAPTEAAAIMPQIEAADSEFWQAVARGERNQGQQVVEVAYVGDRRVTTQEAEVRVAQLVRDLVATAP